MAFTLTCPTTMLDKPILQSLTSTGVATAVHEPGYTVEAQDGREFMYGKFDSSGVAAVAGAPAVWAQTSGDDECIFTADVTDGGLCAIGCFLSVLTDTYFGWIQTKGFVKDAPVTDGAGADVAAADPLGATADSLWTKVTIGGTTPEKAVAVEASSSGVGNICLVQ